MLALLTLFSINTVAVTDTQIERLKLQRDILTAENRLLELTKEDLLNEIKVLYINKVAEKVKGFWRYQGAKDNWGCDVHILQDMDGNVQSVNVQSCNIDNNAKAKSFKNSIERAVYKASPLPKPPIEAVFDNEILLHFKVK